MSHQQTSLQSVETQGILQNQATKDQTQVNTPIHQQITGSVVVTPESDSNKSLSLNQARDMMRQFVDQREWHSFHTPRNLLIAMVGEVGEVSEIFQWKGELQKGLPTFSQTEKQHLGDQLADVFSYLVRLSDVCGVDLSKSFEKKMEKNRAKYPKDLCKGSSKKYTHYKQASRSAAENSVAE